MKKFLILIIALFSTYLLRAQLTPPNLSQRTNGTVTVLDPNLFTSRSFRIPVFQDTLEANQSNTLDSCGKLMYTYSDKAVWYRQCPDMAWKSLNSRDSTTYNFDTTLYLHYKNGDLLDSFPIPISYVAADDPLFIYMDTGGVFHWAIDTTDFMGNTIIADIKFGVLDSLNTPPPASQGDRYLAGTAASSGPFVGHANEIGSYDTLIGNYNWESPDLGDLLYNAFTDKVSKWDGANWVWVNGKLPLHQNGDSYGVPIVAGSNDPYPFHFKTNGIVKNWIDVNGKMYIDSVPLWRGGGTIGTNYNNSNLAWGEKALILNTAGFDNISIGDSSGIKNSIGARNTFLGKSTGQENTTGSSNSFFGWDAGLTNTTGDGNTAVGVQSLTSNSIGTENTAVGHQSLLFGTGSYNTAIGAGSMLSTGTGGYNTGVGAESLRGNQGIGNTGVGYRSGYNMGVGTENTGVGYLSLFGNTTGNYNVGVGSNTLYTNSSGISNVAIGTHSMLYNQTGSNNTAIGYHSLYYHETGDNNVAIGQEAGAYNNGVPGGLGSNSISVGNSILIGRRASVSADGQSQVVVIGDSAIGHGSNTTTIGNVSNLGTYLGGYGAGTITGTPAHGLAIDINNKIIETPPILNPDSLIHEGGDTYGIPITIGSKDDEKVSFIQNNIERAYIDNIPGYNYINTPTGVRMTGTGFGTGLIFSDPYSSIFNSGSNDIIFSAYGGRWLFRDANLDGKIYIKENRTNMKYPVIIGGANILTSPVNDAILELTSTQKGLLLPRMTKAQRNAISPAISTGTIVGGSGYTDGVYNNIAMTGGSGVSIRADITVSGGVVTVVTPDPANTDGQYLVGDVLTSAIPGGSGFTYTITAMVAPAAGMAIYQTDNTPGLRVWNGTNWIKYTEATD